MNERTLESLYTFVLGRETDIALEELKAVLHRLNFVFDVISVSRNMAAINIEKEGDCDVAKLIDILGGTVKIFKIAELKMDDEHPNNERQIESQIADIISKHCQNAAGKLNFGISDYSGQVNQHKVNRLGLEVKKALKNKGFHSRFVALHDGNELSSIVSLKNNLVDRGIEIGLFDGKIGVLIALNNPEEWSKRDYGKPAGDKYSGMTPPKLARMLINVTLGSRARNPKSEIRNPKQSPNVQNPKSQNVLNFENLNLKFTSDLDIRNSNFHRYAVADPFCGSGNILMEALVLGCTAVGSDISEKAVKDTKANLDWLSEELSSVNGQLSSNTRYSIFKADATNRELIENYKLKIENYDHTVIVTEPYLGEPKKFESSYNAACGEYRKVKELYLDFLENLKQSSIQPALCLIFPLVETSDNKRFSLYYESVDEIKSLGYIEWRSPLIYGREYQVVKREIVFLKFKI